MEKNCVHTVPITQLHKSAHKSHTTNYHRHTTLTLFELNQSSFKEQYNHSQCNETQMELSKTSLSIDNNKSSMYNGRYNTRFYKLMKNLEFGTIIFLIEHG